MVYGAAAVILIALSIVGYFRWKEDRVPREILVGVGFAALPVSSTFAVLCVANLVQGARSSEPCALASDAIWAGLGWFVAWFLGALASDLLIYTRAPTS